MRNYFLQIRHLILYNHLWLHVTTKIIVLIFNYIPENVTFSDWLTFYVFILKTVQKKAGWVKTIIIITPGALMLSKELWVTNIFIDVNIENWYRPNFPQTSTSSQSTQTTKTLQKYENSIVILIEFFVKFKSIL